MFPLAVDKPITKYIQIFINVMFSRLRREKGVHFSSSALMPARIVFMGDRRVGTTSMLRRYNLGLYNENYKPEMAPVMRHTKNIFHPKHGCFVTVEFWDVEGADLSNALGSAHKAHAVAVVYDISNRSSFELAQKYLDGINPRVSALLIGNKLDLKNVRKVSYEEGRLLAKIHRVEFIETSAKVNYNVDEAFQILVSCIPDEYLVHVGSNSDLDATVSRRKLTTSSSVVCALCSNKIKRHHDPKGNDLTVGISPSMSHEDGLLRVPSRLQASGYTRLNRSSENIQPLVPEAMRNSQSFFM